MINFFTDPFLRAPTIGSMLMCFASGVVGVLIFVQRRSLLGETLSHATYPGVTLAVVAAAFFGLDEWIPLFILSGALLSALLGLWVMHFLKLRLKVPEDSALCLVLAAFFGVGVTIASSVQFSHTSQFLKIQAYLYGQVATMTDIHIAIYGGLSFLIVAMVFLFYKELQSLFFDRPFTTSRGIASWGIDALFCVIVALALVIGIRSVGVVLMSAMLIAPAASARQYTNRLSLMFFFAGFFGLISGFFGSYLSVILSDVFPGRSFATGPMIVLVASAITLLSLAFAPQKGLVIRYFRIASFRFNRLQENILKAIWRHEKEEISLGELAERQGRSRPYIQLVLFRLMTRGWVKSSKANHYTLTPEGRQKGGRIVRLHRLWEVYLVNYIGVGSERVHKNAEEIEHILSPELEKKLTRLLDNPERDPHNQPIPQPEVDHVP